MEGWSIANGKFDVFKVIMDHFIHSWGVDSCLMRELPATLSQSGFSAVSPLSLHTLVDSSASSYGYRVATRAVDLYETAGKDFEYLLGQDALPILKRLEVGYAPVHDQHKMIAKYQKEKWKEADLSLTDQQQYQPASHGPGPSREDMPPSWEELFKRKGTQ